MTIDRRSLLTGGALLGLAAVAAEPAAAAKPDAERALKDAAVYVPGYYPESAFANGRPISANRRFNRALSDKNGLQKMLTRIGFDGSVRQTLLPVAAHDVEVAPDRSAGVLCSMDGRDHSAFDPETLEMAALAPSFKEGWNGGGHAVYLDGGRTVVMSERAPTAAYDGDPEKHFGRLTIRDPKTLKIVDSHSTHGIDPHDIRLTSDGKYIVAANYGSTVSEKTGAHTVPRNVVEASITVVELSSGKLVDKRMTGRGHVELRHLAAGRLDRIFAIQALYGDDPQESGERAGDAVAYEADITTDPGLNYLPVATLKYDASTRMLGKMGDRAANRVMRHGLSIRYDEKFDQAIASYPSAHQLMVFDGETGRIEKRFDTRTVGLRYPCGITLLPDGIHYAVTGHWENLFVFERGAHRLVRELCLYPVFFGHSHIASA